jgi:hypothetical protein
VERVIAYYERDFPNAERGSIACLRQLAEFLRNVDAARGLEAVPFNQFGFGFFPPGRTGDPATPCLSFWFDDPYPIFWVQFRRHVASDILECDYCMGHDDTWAAAQVHRDRLVLEANRTPPSKERITAEWLAQLTPITTDATG